MEVRRQKYYVAFFSVVLAGLGVNLNNSYYIYGYNCRYLQCIECTHTYMFFGLGCFGTKKNEKKTVVKSLSKKEDRNLRILKL